MSQYFAFIKVAIEGKGLFAFVKRFWTIVKRYGITAGKMDRSLAILSGIIKQYNCEATLPITAVSLSRNASLVQKYQQQGIEFAIHGYVHVDYSQLSYKEQIEHFNKVEQIFQQYDIDFEGFRCPYLRANEYTYKALSGIGIGYDSSHSLFWKVDGIQASESYERALDFYGARSAERYLALPYLDSANNLVCIPYCLPDDESLIERLQWNSPDVVNAIWVLMFKQVHQRGELFVIGLHPERAALCAQALSNVLAAARASLPKVWIARLDEISNWWRTRTDALVEITQKADSTWRVSVNGPSGVTILAKNAEITGPSEPWSDQYQLITGTSCQISANTIPFIGLSSDSSPKLVDFLRQQGYIVQIGNKNQPYSIYFDQPVFEFKDQLTTIEKIEKSDAPLVRLGRWPNGAKSAMSITGDMDAITIWDYILRLIGK